MVKGAFDDSVSFRGKLLQKALIAAIPKSLLACDLQSQEHRLPWAQICFENFSLISGLLIMWHDVFFCILFGF
jgi:hypothetical protein